MRHVCPQDMKKMLIATGEFEGRQRINGLTSIVMSKGSWFWKEAGCSSRHYRKGTVSAIVQVGMKSGAKSQVPAGNGNKKRERPSRNEKWQRGIVTHPRNESQWNRGHFSMKKWESEKHKGWGLPAEGFKGHVVTDGSLLDMAGKWRACGLTAFLCLLEKVIGPIKVHVDIKGNIDALWRGERKCVDLKAGDADLWINIWVKLQLLTLMEILVEVGHVKAHRTEKDKQEMSHFEKFVTDGNEEADELAKAGAMLDEGFMAQTRAKTHEKMCTNLAACNQLSLLGGGMERL